MCVYVKPIFLFAEQHIFCKLIGFCRRALFDTIANRALQSTECHINVTVKGLSSLVAAAVSFVNN